uniref:Uncharacterized protein n=1 Tax=Arundo donax TaxID=35708 RepID=A0A0A9BNI0_ARUDO
MPQAQRSSPGLSCLARPRHQQGTDGQRRLVGLLLLEIESASPSSVGWFPSSTKGNVN